MNYLLHVLFDALLFSSGVIVGLLAARRGSGDRS
jgi:hypothetical protein